MIHIDTSIVAVYMIGDVKDKVRHCKYTHLATYDSVKNETLVIVQTGTATTRQQGELEREIKAVYVLYGKVKKAKYYKDGADIVQASTN